ncbi:MAG: CBS domain-containing protein [Gammaproteobacteria bacterium]|nr:CBS domain-containing protein [Gammaproteobacteria bacterium]
MNLSDVVIPTGVVRAGMTFEDGVRVCVEKGVPGIPYVDQNGDIIGRFSLRHAFRMACVSNSAFVGGQLLGDDIDYFTNTSMDVASVKLEPVEGYLLDDSIQLEKDAGIEQILQRMEDYNTGYLFLEQDGCYLGVITRIGVAQLILEGGC